MLDPEKFDVVAGANVVAAMRAERERRVPMRGPCFESESLCALQREEAARGILGAEIVRSNYGHSVRYDSGLQNFGLLAGSRSGPLDGSLEDAVRWATEWQARDPARRYVWIRKEARQAAG